METWLCALVSVHLHTFILLLGYFSLSQVDQQQRQLAVRFYSRWYYVRSGVGVSGTRIGSGMNKFNTKETKIFRPKNFHIFGFLKAPVKLFVYLVVVYWRRTGNLYGDVHLRLHNSLRLLSKLVKINIEVVDLS